MFNAINILSILASSGFLAVRVSTTTGCIDSFYVKNESGWIQDCELSEKHHLGFRAKKLGSEVGIVFSLDSQFLELHGRRETYLLSKHKVCLDVKKAMDSVQCFVIRRRFDSSAATSAVGKP